MIRTFSRILEHQIISGDSARSLDQIIETNSHLSQCLEARGAYTYNKLQAICPHPNGTPATPSDVLDDLEQHSCPSAGACGGMYTANTMATAIEVMGLSLPGSSSNPATSPEKARECERAAAVIRTAMEKDIRPRDLLCVIPPHDTPST